MVEYSCDKCGNDFKQKSHLKAHMNRKNPCVKESKIQKEVIELKNNKKEIKYIDLFCGLGAFHTAFKSLETENEKYTCIFACDIDENVRKIYNENYNLMPEGDINKIKINEIPDFDILCAGFPCQPFSIAGSKKGFEDNEKGNLFFSILKIIDIKKPKTLILENVKNLLTINKGETFKIIKTELEKRGYKISYDIIDSKFYNVPQSRERLFIVGSLDKSFTFPKLKNKIVPVSNILDKNEKKFIDYINKYRLDKTNNTVDKENPTMLYRVINKATNLGGRQGERVYSIDSCGPTICASSGGIGSKTGLYYINKKIRKLNVKECLQMFGYNTDYKWTTIVNEEDMKFYLGNSIVVTVIKELLKKLFNFSDSQIIKDGLKQLDSEIVKGDLKQSSSEIAKGGFDEEDKIVDILNKKKDILEGLSNFLNKKIENNFAVYPKYLKKKSDCHNKELKIQVKKSQANFGQIDRHYVDFLTTKVQKIKPIEYILKNLCEKKVNESGFCIGKRIEINDKNYKNEEIDKLKKILNDNKKDIIKLALIGDEDEYKPEILSISEYNKNKICERIIFYKTSDVLDFLYKQEIEIRDTVIAFGKCLTIQRKGGDKNKKTANQYQFKLKPKDLMIDTSYIYEIS